MSRIDPIVLITIFACATFISLHLVLGGATILLCFALIVMVLIVFAGVAQKRAWQKNENKVKAFDSIRNVDVSLFWKSAFESRISASCCPICLDNSEPQKISLCCGNSFHQSCLIQYIYHNQARNLKCPICRESCRLSFRSHVLV